MNIGKYTKKALGTDSPFDNRQYWIGAAIAGAVSLGSAIWGGISSSNANKKSQQQLKSERARENAWYRRRYNEDYSDTAAGQRTITMAKDYAEKNWKKAQGAAAVAGGTDAATAMAKQAGNDMVAQGIAANAAQDTARKDNIDQQHRQAENSYSQQKAAIEQQRANNIAQVASQASNAAISVAGSLIGSPTATKTANTDTATANTTRTDLTGSGNNSTPVNVSPEELYGPEYPNYIR